MRFYISAMCDRSTTINYVPDEGPRGVSGLVPNKFQEFPNSLNLIKHPVTMRIFLIIFQCFESVQNWKGLREAQCQGGVPGHLSGF